MENLCYIEDIDYGGNHLASGRSKETLKGSLVGDAKSKNSGCLFIS